MRKSSRRVLTGVGTCMALLLLTGLVSQTPATAMALHDGPSGFWWGTDSLPVTVPGGATYHEGVGSGAYWFMGGPGVDPDYNGSAAEASTWGARQAARALSDIAGN